MGNGLFAITVSPGYRRATTGAGVGLPLLFFLVVILLSGYTYLTATLHIDTNNYKPPAHTIFLSVLRTKPHLRSTKGTAPLRRVLRSRHYIDGVRIETPRYVALEAQLSSSSSSSLSSSSSSSPSFAPTFSTSTSILSSYPKPSEIFRNSDSTRRTQLQRISKGTVVRDFLEDTEITRKSGTRNVVARVKRGISNVNFPLDHVTNKIFNSRIKISLLHGSHDDGTADDHLGAKVENGVIANRGLVQAWGSEGNVESSAKDEGLLARPNVIRGGGGDSVGADDHSGIKLRNATSGPMSTRPSYSAKIRNGSETVETNLDADLGPEKRPVAVEETFDTREGVSSTTTTQKISTELTPTTRDTPMETLNASGYIVSAVLVLLVGALVGVLATVSHHLHHRRLLSHGTASILHHHHHHHHHHYHHHHHHRHHHSENSVLSQQQRLLPPDHQRHPVTPMLSVSPGMEVGSGGGHGGISRRGIEGALARRNAKDVQEVMVAAARDRAVRTGSVRQDLALDLPPRLQLPDGEERPYGAHTSIHLRDPEQESEIYQKCVRPPPNRTIFDSESPPPYRSQSVLLEPPERIVRCHSASSSLLRVFRKSGVSGTTTTTSTAMTIATMAMAMATTTTTTATTTTTTTIAAPRQLTLSSYSESSSNISNLSNLTVVPCETNENQQRYQHV